MFHYCITVNYCVTQPSLDIARRFPYRLLKSGHPVARPSGRDMGRLLRVNQGPMFITFAIIVIVGICTTGRLGRWLAVMAYHRSYHTICDTGFNTYVYLYSVVMLIRTSFRPPYVSYVHILCMIVNCFVYTCTLMF